jgi:streptogramin lyase
MRSLRTLLLFSASFPEGITVGPDGNLWFIERNYNKVGRVTTSGVFTEFPIPTPYGSPYGIATGLDANLWFTEFDGNKIGPDHHLRGLQRVPHPYVPQFPLRHRDRARRESVVYGVGR